jgi:hypothetical protein
MSTWQATARSLARRLVDQQKLALAVATALLVLVGVIAASTEAYGIALLCVLLLQAAIAGYLVTAPEPGIADDAATRAAVDRASARTLADLAHARQAILDAIAQTSTAAPADRKAP